MVKPRCNVFPAVPVPISGGRGGGALGKSQWSSSNWGFTLHWAIFARPLPDLRSSRGLTL